jgi:hypothetical protein
MRASIVEGHQGVWLTPDSTLRRLISGNRVMKQCTWSCENLYSTQPVSVTRFRSPGYSMADLQVKHLSLLSFDEKRRPTAGQSILSSPPCTSLVYDRHTALCRDPATSRALIAGIERRTHRRDRMPSCVHVPCMPVRSRLRF